MDWTPYKACCHTSALDAEAGFCPECGTPLLRCVAFSECRGIVRPHRHCEVCVSPTLSIDSGAITAVTVGERLSIPLVLTNSSSVARPLWVKRAAMRLGNSGQYTPIPLMWERVDPGQERMFTVETDRLEAGGAGAVSLALTLASSYKGYEECYIFGGDVRFQVNTENDGKIIQNIDLSGATLGTGTLVHTPLSFEQRQQTDGRTTSERILIPIEPFERMELDDGVRGYRDTRHRVSRNAAFTFSCFPRDHAPAQPLHIGSRGLLILGRNLRQPVAGEDLEPSDVVLRVVDTKTGEVDRTASFAVSRRHFDLVILNERLCAHIRSGNGAAVNGQPVPTASLVVLADGDVIAPLTDHPHLLSLKVRFVPRPDGIVDEIQIIREPSVSNSS